MGYKEAGTLEALSHQKLFGKLRLRLRLRKLNI